MARYEAAEGAEEQSPARKDGTKQVLVAGVLLFGMVIVSASAAVLVASLLIKPDAVIGPGSNGPAAVKGADAVTARPGQDPEKSERERPAVAGKAGPQIEFEDALIVNVYRTNQRRFLSCKPVFVMADEKVKKALEGRLVDLKDLLITLLKGKTLDQLDEPGVTHEIAREIVEIANEKLKLDSGIVRVKFTQFVVQ